MLAREHVGGHDGAGRPARGAQVSAHEELVEGGELVEREDPAHGARAEAVAMEHERAAGRGAGHVAAWGDGRSRVVDGGRAGEPVLDAEREADDS